jgi:carboxyl-terminal processing protease
MKKRISYRILALLIALLISLTSLTACSSLLFGGPQNDFDSENATDFSELELIDQLFKSLSLFELDEDALMEAVLKGYVEGTGDKYAEYFTAEEYEQFTSSNQGETVGVGISVIQNVEHSCIEIINVIPESPAMKAGVLPGDLIVYIGIGENRQSVSALGYTNSLDKLVGDVGSLAEFVVLRDGEEIEFSIAREKVNFVSVTSRVCSIEGYEKVGIVRITEFNLTTPTDFEKEVDKLIALDCDKFIFDVRYNPGGDLESIKAVLSYFLNNGDTVIRIVDKNGKETSQKIEPVEHKGDYKGCSIDKKDIGKYRDLDFAVLTNGSTASAAELFTSVLMDYKLSLTVGTKTYGKGTMQTTYSLARYGYSGAIKLTTKYYNPPISPSYEGKGITPDIVEELDEALKNVNIYKITDEEDNQLRRAIEELYKK